MKRALALVSAILIAAAPLRAAEYESWANWQRRIDDAYKGLKHRKVPGKTVGLVVPAEDRDDIMTLTAAAYNVVQKSSFHTVLIFLQAPPTAALDGMAVPDAAVFDTSFGRFSVDTNLRDKLLSGSFPARVDPTLFGLEPPRVVQRQLAFLKQLLRGSATQLRVLPVYVKFSNANDQVRDFAPFVVDQIREAGVDKDLLVITAADLTRASSDAALIKADATTLRGVRNLDVDALIEGKDDATLPDLDALVMGLLTLRWAGADHGEILAYGDSGHLVLTKDKRTPVSYVAAGIASAPPLPEDLPHAPQQKMLEIFEDSLRADILTMTRQACLSAIDPTAAKPPALSGYKEASKKWPVYVSVYDDKGSLVGQAGSHVATGPLEESLRRYAVEAIHHANRPLDRAFFKTCVVDVSIPFGFFKISNPDDLVPLLNGAVVYANHKSLALHPDAWRKYPDPHQLLAQASWRLDLPPWGYALGTTTLDSFRIFAFNEKEPMPAMVQPERGKKKKGGGEEEDLPSTGGSSGGGSSGGGAFGF